MSGTVLNSVIFVSDFRSYVSYNSDSLFGKRKKTRLFTKTYHRRLQLLRGIFCLTTPYFILPDSYLHSLCSVCHCFMDVVLDQTRIRSSSRHMRLVSTVHRNQKKTLLKIKFKYQSNLTGFLGILTFLAISSQTQSFNSELPKVSYIKAIDVWMFVCNLFVFLSLMEYAFAQVIIQFNFNFGSIKYLWIK